MQLSQDVLNKRFEGKIPTPFGGRREVSRALDPTRPETGATGITHGFQPRLLNQPSELAFDDDCRWAVSHLNTLRLQRAENLGDGYDVSDILCDDID